MRRQIAEAKRLVVKVGSALVTNGGQGLDHGFIADCARQIAALHAEGRQVLLVSSGAIAAGMQRLGWKTRPHAMHDLQAAAALSILQLIIVTASLLVASAMIPLAGWRGGFIVTALFPLCGLLLGWWSLRGVPNIVHAQPDGHSQFRALAEVWRNKPAMLSIWGYTFHAWELLGLWAWLPAFLTAALIAQGSSPENALLLAGLTYVANIGGSIVGPNAGDMIGEIVLAIEMGADALDIGKTIHPHPTLGESIGMAAEMAHGSCTDLPPQRKR